ncbi:PQQ-binding-like beta-propeller repeat protein [Roseibium sp.]|uniref:outer membrane protein assembly factor BamB family protein n=1 Tax=Roseibium sp. TaxID=1936156 RepID=UPI003A97E0A5
MTWLKFQRATAVQFRPVALAVLLSSGLAACGSVSEFAGNMNPWGKEKILAGDRKALFDNNDPAIEATAKPASFGSASGGQTWTTVGGNAENNPGNVAISISGSRVWRASIGSSGGGLTSDALRSYARPVSDGSRVFVYKPSGDVVALSTGGGRLWTRSLRPEGERDLAPGGGVAVSGGRVYAATAYRTLAALDAGSGQVLWQVDLPTPARGAPAVGQGKVFVVSQSNEVYALNLEDGSEAWSYTGIEENAGVLSAAAPAVSGKKVVVPFSSGEVMAIDTESGEADWIDGVTRGIRTFALSGLSDVSASPVIAGGTVYATGVSGRILAASLKTGSREWAQDLGSVHTPVVSGNSLFMVDLDDRLVALDRKSGEILWATVLPKPQKKKQRRNWAGPLLANGALVVMSSDGRMALVDAASGKIMTTNDVKTDVYVAPIAAGGRMIVLDGDDAVAAFR